MEFEEITAGNLAVRIAKTEAEIVAAQKLRYRIFFEEMKGIPTPEMKQQQRDFDQFDANCDHLIIVDNDLPDHSNQVVGTYRLMRRNNLGNLEHFYTEGEFDISAIKKEEGEILELGRSCVDANYRNRSLMNLLWKGIGTYVSQYDIKLMFGCGSFAGIDIEEHRLALSYLYHYHLAPDAIRAVALKDQYVEMNQMAKESINEKEAFNAVPALIKGYLRLGGYVGLGAVVDKDFNTTDVGIIVQSDLVTEKYAQRYAKPL